MPPFLGRGFFRVNQITELRRRRSPLLWHNMPSLTTSPKLSKKCYPETKSCSHSLGKSQMRRHVFPTTPGTFLFKVFSCCCLKISHEDFSLAFQQSGHVLQKHCPWKGLSGEVREVTAGAERVGDPALRCVVRKHIKWQEPPRGTLFQVHLHCKCGQRALVTHLPDSSSFRCQNVPCLLEKWTPAKCSPRLLLSGPGLDVCFFSFSFLCSEPRVKEASHWCVKSSSLEYVKQGSGTTSCNQVPLVGLCLVPFYC